MIEGVKVKPLRVIPDERGRLMEILRSDDGIFLKFGQVYMTTVLPGVIKGWHYHNIQTDNFAAVQGMVKLVLYDAREKSPTRGEISEYYMGVHSPILVQIPPGVHHGFKCVSEEEAIIINVPTEVYNYKKPDELKCDPHSKEIPYDWSRKDR